MAAELDFVSYDNYPVWGGLKSRSSPPKRHDAGLYTRAEAAKFLDCRAAHGRKATTTSAIYRVRSRLQLWAYQAMARGCDNMLFSAGAVWIAARNSFTSQWYRDIDNETGRKYREVQGIHATSRSSRV